jgi:hypothetical protein
MRRIQRSLLIMKLLGIWQLGNFVIWQFKTRDRVGNCARGRFQITKLSDYKITNLSRLVQPYYEIDPPVDNPPYPP